MTTAVPTPAAPPPSSPTTGPSTPAGQDTKSVSTPTAATSAPQKTAVNAPQGASSVSPDEKPASTPTETAAERKARLIKYKVDGAEKELNIDELDDLELTKRLQLSEAAQKRMAEAAEYRKAFESFREAVKKDPFAALKDEAFGLDLEKLAEDRIMQKYQEQMAQENLTEPERRALQLERELQTERQKLAQIQQAEEAKKQAEVEKQVFQETYTMFESALQQENVPRSRTTMRMMAEVAAQSLEHGIELTPAQLAAEVNSRLGEMNGHVLKGLKGEQLFKYLGDEVVKEVLKYSVERVRQKSPSFVPKEDAPPRASAESEPEEKKIARKMQDLKAWRMYLRNG